MLEMMFDDSALICDRGLVRFCISFIVVVRVSIVCNGRPFLRDESCSIVTLFHLHDRACRLFLLELLWSNTIQVIFATRVEAFLSMVHFCCHRSSAFFLNSVGLMSMVVKLRH